jgi:hypothetical protein
MDFVPRDTMIKTGITCLAAGLIVGGSLGAFTGYKVMAARYYEEKADTTEILIKLVEAANRVTVKYETVFVDRVEKVYIRGRVVEKEVIKYVNAEDDAACQLRNGFVRMYDASLHGGVTGPAADTDREPSGITLSRATEDVLVPNNTELLACYARLEGWQQFYGELRETYRKGKVIN